MFSLNSRVAFYSRIWQWRVLAVAKVVSCASPTWITSNFQTWTANFCFVTMTLGWAFIVRNVSHLIWLWFHIKCTLFDWYLHTLPKCISWLIPEIYAVGVNYPILGNHEMKSYIAVVPFLISTENDEEITEKIIGENANKNSITSWLLLLQNWHHSGYFYPPTCQMGVGITRERKNHGSGSGGFHC